MEISTELQNVVDCIFKQQLSKALTLLENYLYTYSTQPQALEQLEQLKSDYGLMTDYWQKGFNDPQRTQLYGQLLRRLYVLTTNVAIRRGISSSTYVKTAYTDARSGRKNWSPSGLYRDLEGFVSDMAMLDLEPEHTRQSRQSALYEVHQNMMVNVFDYIWTSRLWNDSVTEAFEDMVLSPTIATIDQQLIVSAITVSLINYFDFNKFRLLMRVYQQTLDEAVRQRALVGWVLGLDSQAAQLYTEVHELIAEAVSDERCRDELTELQMQMIYCLRAESDTRIIQHEIMPELIKNNNIRITHNGIEEIEDDPMEDVLHPERSEQRMEKLEESMRRMIDMQRQGSDIYFGGFSQMKRFPFFQTVANWFVPFYSQHPAVSPILSKTRGRKFLKMLLDNGPFCDSDKYSFILGFEMAVSRLPESLLNMMDRGEATLVGAELGTDNFRSPAFIRRSYLQTIFRFYRVYPSRSYFRDPFAPTDVPRFSFFASPVFQHTALEEKFNQVVAFFLKHEAYNAAMLTLQNYRQELRDVRFYLLNGRVLAKTHNAVNAGLTSAMCYALALKADPENEKVWSGYARTLFASKEYEQSLNLYCRLLERHPDSLNYQLNVAVCLTKLGRHDEALKTLFKLNYEMPDNDNVSRVLAWTLVEVCRYEQATAIYDRLLKSDRPAPGDMLNAAYCHWFQRHVALATKLFRQYAAQEGVHFDAEHEFMTTESVLLRTHGVSTVEIRLMIDQLSS